MANDYYATLGVEPDVSADDIKRAFRQLAREHHPDATGGDAESEQRYKEISEAYAVLSDARKRQEYDAARMGVGTWSSPWASPFASTIEDIFSSFFGGGNVAQRQRTRARPGESIEVQLDVTLEEVVFGAEKPLHFERFEPCERCSGAGTEPGTHPERCDVCHGSGQVQQTRRTVIGSLVTAFPCRECGGEGWIVPDPCKGCRAAGRIAQDIDIPLQVPPGIDDGDRLRLDSEGEAGLAGGGRGDLYVRFHVIPDERFERMGDDLYTWVEIPMTLAALGGGVSVATLDGDDKLEVLAGTQSNAVFRLRGKGVPRRHGRGRGDLIVRAHVETPTSMGKKEKELLRQLADLRDEHPKGETKGVFRRVLGRD
jgi:molecular chaperone DnaJ